MENGLWRFKGMLQPLPTLAKLQKAPQVNGNEWKLKLAQTEGIQH